MISRLITLSMMTCMLIACAGNQKADTNDGTKLSGLISIDGSSTVYPITEAVAEEFKVDQPEVKISVALSGTGGGFKKFGRGEIDINDASRPIKPSEDSIAKANNVSYVELIVAFDGMAIVVNPQNDWCNDMTVAELKMLWAPRSEERRV